VLARVRESVSKCGHTPNADMIDVVTYAILSCRLNVSKLFTRLFVGMLMLTHQLHTLIATTASHKLLTGYHTRPLTMLAVATMSAFAESESMRV
jgi:hypothetical protein